MFIKPNISNNQFSKHHMNFKQFLAQNLNNICLFLLANIVYDYLTTYFKEFSCFKTYKEKC